MFAYIKGSLEEKSSNYIVVEAMGIGYKIFMGESSINSLGEIGDNIKIHTHYHVREDDISLYGFKTNEELRMFELLISVGGVGAKSALSILTNVEPSAFALAVISNDTSKLVKIPGVGAKTAARIVLELKDKLKNQDLVDKKKDVINKNILDEEELDEATSALQVLGYNRKDIEKVFEKLDISGLKLEEMIKLGLKHLSRN